MPKHTEPPAEPQPENGNGNTKVWTGLKLIDGFFNFALALLKIGGPYLLMAAVACAALCVDFYFRQLPESEARRKAMEKVGESQDKIADLLAIVQSKEIEQTAGQIAQWKLQDEHHRTSLDAHNVQGKALLENQELLKAGQKALEKLLATRPEKNGNGG